MLAKPGSEPPFRIQEEDPATVLADLAALLQGTRSQAGALDVGGLRWKYLENPDGPAVVWTIRSAGGAMMGYTACLPRRMRVDGRDVVAWNGADFSILPEYRTLGPAIELRRQATLEVAAGRADFLYAHPNPRMAVVHRRVGHQRLGSMQRWARPLNLADRVPPGRQGSPLRLLVRGVVDPLFRTTQRIVLSRDRTVRVAPRVEFDERFDGLFQRQATQSGVVGIRDARYLNWRWNPASGSRPVLLLSERDSELRGYAILDQGPEGMRIRDLFPDNDPQVVQGLAAAACRYSLGCDVPSVNLTVLEGNPLLSSLSNRLFSLRPDVTESFVFYPPARADLEPVSRPSAWFMTSGDRDI